MSIVLKVAILLGFAFAIALTVRTGETPKCLDAYEPIEAGWGFANYEIEDLAGEFAQRLEDELTSRDDWRTIMSSTYVDHCSSTFSDGPTEIEFWWLPDRENVIRVEVRRRNIIGAIFDRNVLSTSRCLIR